MNSLYKFSFVFVLAIMATTTFGQTKTDTTMIVNGVCGMCKSTIQKACKMDGVYSADWDVDSKVLTLSFDSEKLSLQLTKMINQLHYPVPMYFGKEPPPEPLPIKTGNTLLKKCLKPTLWW